MVAQHPSHSERGREHSLGPESELSVVGANPLVIATTEDGVGHGSRHPAEGRQSHLRGEGTERVSPTGERWLDGVPLNQTPGSLGTIPVYSQAVGTISQHSSTPHPGPFAKGPAVQKGCPMRLLG